MTLTTPHSVTSSLAWATAIACLSTLQFGFHLAELNAPEALLSCNFHRNGPLPTYEDTLWSQYGRKQCIPMSGTGIATITTMFTIGGFIASVLVGSSELSSSVGRRSMSKLTSGIYFLGSIIMAVSNSFWLFNIGRFITGVAAGLSLVVSPIWVNELTPINHRGLLGSCLQLAVAMGILLAQLVGYLWSNDQQWRNIFVFSACIGLLQFVVLFTTIESPKWLIINRGDIHGAKRILKNLRTDHGAAEYEINHWRRLSINVPSKPVNKNETSALLADINNSLRVDVTDSFLPLTRTVSRRGSIDPTSITIGEFLTNKKFILERTSVFAIMTGLQLCGINAITFYGVRILKDIVPKGTNVLVITCSLSVCNVIAAILVSPLVDKLGRKPLLLTSVGVMAFCSLTIALGLTHDWDYVVAGSSFGFIIGYSMGLAPIPFLMISELASHESLGSAQSVGTALNWASNVTVAFSFPILQDLIGGYVFYGFFVICTSYAIFFYKFLPETKGFHSAEEVWRNFKN